MMTILIDGRPVPLAQALDLVRARYGVAPGEPVFSQERS